LMRLFEQEAAGIYRLRVPFENLTTSVFLLVTQEGPVLYDCATTPQDVEMIILPALAQMHIAPGQLHAVILSHAHGDHRGGLMTLLKHAPQVRVLSQSSWKYESAVDIPTDGEMLFGSIQALYLPGHAVDCLGLYDVRTQTLLTADALQLQGIGRYGCMLTNPDAYVHTVEKIRRLAPQRILTSHDYVPYGEKAEGIQDVERYLNGCLEVLQEIKAFVFLHQSELDAKALTEAFRAEHPQRPLLSETTIKRLLEESFSK